MLSQGVLASILLASIAVAQTAPQKYVPAPPEQPLPFSHKKHLALRLECKECHAMPSPGEQATFPPTAKCMSCHATIKTDSPAIQRLTGYDRNKEEIQWKRVYRVPDFVFFSHETHVVQANLACEDCHGNVRELEVMRKEKPTNMAACMDCHRSKDAPVACDSCHAPR
jgi:hypothetical protein